MYGNIDFYTKIVEIGLSTGKLAHIEIMQTYHLNKRLYRIAGKFALNLNV